MIRWQPKRPAETRDYTHDWTPFLGTDTIVSKVDVATGLTLSSSTILTGSRSVKFVVTGGTDGTVASIVQTITTAGGNVESETFLIPIGIVEEPLSLAEAKSQVRVLDDSEDAYIESLIAPARRYVENRSGIIIKRRQFIERHEPVRGAIRLYNGPVVTIDEVAYLDSAGADAVYADARFFGGSSFIFPALGESWPTPYAGEAFAVTYTAGLSPEELGTDEYSNLLHAMKLLVGHWFTTRSGVSTSGDIVREVPLAANDLCDQVRMPVV